MEEAQECEGLGEYDLQPMASGITLTMPFRYLQIDHGIYRVAARSKLWRSLGSTEWIDGKGERLSAGSISGPS
jgi:hypothetical protein